MTNLTPVSSFDNVRQLETTDLGLAGPGGPLNEQAQALLNRTKYLNDRRLDLSDVADPLKGAGIIGRGGQVVDSIAALRALDKNAASKNAFATGYRAAGDGGGGPYALRVGDITSVDNGGTMIVATDGGRWELTQQGAVSIKQFGGVAGVFDAPSLAINDVALQKARDWVAGNAVRNKLDGTAGIYGYTVSPNWAIQHAQIDFHGEVRFRYFGTGNAVILDAGPTAPDLVYNMKFGAGNKLIVECPSTALDAVFVRGVHHSVVGINVLGAGAANAGLNVQFAVCTKFYVTCSVNEEGWYLGAKPAVGIKLDQRLAGETTSYCKFPNPIIEGPDVGIELVNTLGNIFDGGTAEACLQYGVFAAVGASGDRFDKTDFEANGIADVYSLGSGVEIISCDSDNEINFGSTATLCRVTGGRHKDILFDTGSAGCSANDTVYNRSNNGGTFIDSGTNSIVKGVRNGGTNVIYLTGSATYDPPSIPSGSAAQTTVSVPGLKFGDTVLAAFSQSLLATSMSATVSASDVATVAFINLSGAPVDLTSGTLSCTGFRGN